MRGSALVASGLAAMLTPSCTTLEGNAAAGTALQIIGAEGPYNTPANRATGLGLTVAGTALNARAQSQIAREGAPQVNVYVNEVEQDYVRIRKEKQEQYYQEIRRQKRLEEKN